MKLFYLPGSCALGPHIALEYAGLAYEAVRVERGRQNDPAYLAINPLRVPALVTATHGTITEARGCPLLHCGCCYGQRAATGYWDARTI